MNKSTFLKIKKTGESVQKHAADFSQKTSWKQGLCLPPILQKYVCYSAVALVNFLRSQKSPKSYTHLREKDEKVQEITLQGSQNSTFLFKMWDMSWERDTI